jgi:muramoyltetrapeptide carboxypeptidase LdcA involved in peptidoglycan recycling
MARINRMVHHLEQSGGLKGVKAIVLGDFLDCNDTVPQCLQHQPPNDLHFTEYLRHPPKEFMGPLRTAISSSEALDFVFSSLGERNQIAVYKGLPIGHGPNFHSISLGKKASLKKDGKFST